MSATADRDQVVAVIVESQPLQSSLHAATRTLHSQLNANIIKRLPQCLPPQAQDPTSYHLGMLTFGQIFVAFEKGIEDALNEHGHSLEAERARQVRILEALHTRGLARTIRLKHDADTLSLRLFSSKSVNEVGVLRQVEGKLRSDVHAKTRQITDRVRQKPYLALAYSWTMYLALFNGGRHIHRALQRAGPGFWLEAEQEATGEENNVLTFWRFEAATDEDPEADQLKLEFKTRFDEATQLLTVGERDEVVVEAKSIFDLCMEQVEFLDGVMRDYAQDAAQAVALHDLNQPDTQSNTWSSIASGMLAPLDQLLNLGWGRLRVEEVKE